MIKHSSKTLAFLTFLCINLSLNAQINDYKKVQYIWDSTALKNILPQKIFLNEDAIILDRKVEIKLPSNVKSNNTILTQNTYLTKTDRVLINNKNAIHYFTHLALPENIDPFVNWENRNFGYNFNGAYNIINNYRVMYFAVRIINKDGHIYIPEINAENKIDSIFYENAPLRRIKTHFNYSTLEIGDEIQIAYKLEIEPESNWLDFNQFVFNDKFPIQNFNFLLSYTNWQSPLVIKKNGAHVGYDSITYMDGETKRVQLKWARTNLSAYDFSNPYSKIDAVPYVSICMYNEAYLKPYFYETLLHNTFESKYKIQDCYISKAVQLNSRYLLYYPYITFQHKQNEKEYYLSKNNNERQAYRKIYKEILKDTTATNDLYKMAAIHNKLNEYKTTDYIEISKKNVPWLTSYYDYLNDKIFRVDYANLIYEGIFEHLDSTYYTVFCPDKRLKKFDSSNVSISMPHYSIFSFINNSAFCYLMPRTKYTRYYVNELPYYLEDNLSLHIPQNLAPPIDCNDYSKKATIIYLNTPPSTSLDNYRQITGKVTINLSQSQLSYTGKVSLSGQFSTLLRDFYQLNTIDPTIHKDYSIRMSDGVDATSIKYELLNTSNEYPFKTSFKSTFQNNSLKILNQQSLGIELSNWFHFVHPDSAFINAESRLFEYVPDFLCNDKFKYQLEFDTPIVIENMNDFKVDIENDYANFHTNLIKLSDTTYGIDANLEIKQKKVPAYNLKNVETICAALGRIKKAKLVIKKV